MSTMVVLREPDEVYLLCHTGGDDAISWVEQIDPVTLEVVRRSPDLPGGPTWPGGMAVHADGSLYVVFGRYAHRLSPTLDVLAATELPRHRPYNSFVVLPSGHLDTQDFAFFPTRGYNANLAYFEAVRESGDFGKYVLCGNSYLDRKSVV